MLLARDGGVAVVRSLPTLPGGSRKGFTLIELMIVVVIMGVLAAIAIMSYRIYIQRARTAEAAGLLANIKASQESYRSEFGMYCNVNNEAPAADPGPAAVVWDTAKVNNRWSQLGFRPDNRAIFFTLNTVAGAPGTAAPGGWVGGAGITLPDAAATFYRDHWFIARARGDQDDDGAEALFWITHMTTGVDRRNPTE